MSIATKTGDKGHTSLVGGSRVSKGDMRVEAYGTLDELGSGMGFARSICRHDVERPHPYITTASIVVLLPDRILMAADGGPCRSVYSRFAV